ncbi:MAG: hypothetical protein PHI15_00485 [Methanomicrobium sp.]|nr:hypothetical protein [Methanomicrobium sp.]
MRFIEDEEGLSEVVGFILILGLLVMAMSLYVVYEVPNKGRENEIEHMNDIKNRFVDYKISLDSIWINSVSYNNQVLVEGDSQFSVYGVNLGTSFDLGTSGGTYSGDNSIVPFFTPLPSSGYMEADENHGNIEILVNSQSIYNETLGSLNYISYNNYWIDQQYYYQMGGVFLRQDSGITVRVSPIFSIYNVSGKTAIQITPVKINGMRTVSGSGSLKVDSRLMQTPQIFSETQIVDNLKIIITCSDNYEALMWEKYISQIRRGNNIYEGYCTITRLDNTVTIEISGPGEGGVLFDLYNAEFSVDLANVASGIT